MFSRLTNNNNGDDHDTHDDHIQRDESEKATLFEMDALLEKEMKKLTTQDREKVIQRLHGITKDDEIVQEDPEFIQQKCNELHMFLDEQLRKEIKESSSQKTKSSFAKAVQQDKSFIYCKEFFTWFLRGNEYNIQATAKQMYLHFAKKEELFGEALLARDIVQSDLNESDLEVVASGYLQKLPCYDRAGRLVIVFFPALKPQIKNPINMERATWYMASKYKFEPSEVQCKGVVTIIYELGRHNALRRDVHIAKIGNLFKCMPAKKAGIHICYDLPHLQVLVATILLFAGRDVRIRTCRHFGTAMECKYKLMTYGIPHHAFPVEDDGTIDMESHIQFLVWTRIQEMNKEQQQQHSKQETLTRQKLCHSKSLEQAETSPEEISTVRQVLDDSVPQQDQDQLVDLLQTRQERIAHNLYNSDNESADQGDSNEEDDNNKDSNCISVPRRNDVLFGKGKMILNHPGNLKFHYLIESYAEDYDKATKKSAKTEISREIMQTIQINGNGRFLKWHSNGWWEQVSDDVARNKVSHAFRTRRASILSRSTKGGNNDNNNNSKGKECKKRGNDVVTDSNKNVRKRGEFELDAQEKEIQEKDIVEHKVGLKQAAAVLEQSALEQQDGLNLDGLEMDVLEEDVLELDGLELDALELDDALCNNIDDNKDTIYHHDNEKEGMEEISIFDRKIFPTPEADNSELH